MKQNSIFLEYFFKQAQLVFSRLNSPGYLGARLGTVSGCHWTCIWIIQSYSAIFFLFLFKKERNQKPDVQESLGITGYKIRTSCATVPTTVWVSSSPCPRPHHIPPHCCYDSPLCLHNTGLYPFWMHEILGFFLLSLEAHEWLEHVTVSFSGSSSFSWHGANLLCSWIVYGSSLKTGIQHVVVLIATITFSCL